MLATEKIIGKIQALLAQADHANTGKAEASAFRAKAEKLMQEYRIEEGEALARGEAPSLKPVSKWMPVALFVNEFLDSYRSLAYYVAQHTGVECVGKHQRGDDGIWYGLVLVGFESDVQFAELLFASIRLAFAANLEPQYNSNETEEQNVYRMRNAGMTRDAIGQAMDWLSGDKPLTASAAADKASKLYGKACRELGAEPKLLGKGTSMKVYKELYAESFVHSLYYRLADARNGVDNEAGALVLANRKEMVTEAFYELFPQFRPAASPAVRETAPVKEETEAQRKRRQARMDRENEERIRRQQSVAGQAGIRNGRAAAASVDLGGTAPTKRLV